jgi:hypothetical protein
MLVSINSFLPTRNDRENRTRLQLLLHFFVLAPTSALALGLIVVTRKSICLHVPGIWLLRSLSSCCLAWLLLFLLLNHIPLLQGTVRYMFSSCAIISIREVCIVSLLPGL